MRILQSIVVATALGACKPAQIEEVPEFVYLRTESVIVAVTVSSETQIKVDEWLRLSAVRTTSGEWRKVPFKEVSENTPWIGYLPPEREAEVAANLRWHAEPREGVSFDAWAPRPVPTTERAVKFLKPGTYRLWATSHAPLDATSNSLQVMVLPK
ncbi:MAG: hypothetical protein AB7G13_28380 [Lautropia sp.]